MTNSFYNDTGVPQTRAPGYSAVIRAEFASIEAAFDKFPTLSTNANKPFVVNSAGTAVTTTTGTLALAGNFATAGAYSVTLTFTGATGVTFPTTGTLATLAGTETFTNKTLTAPVMTAPVLGTPASGNLSNCTAYPMSALTGLGTGVATFLATPSSANLAAAVTGETGTGALVFAESPTLVTPALGTPASGVLTNATGLPEAGLTLADNTTNNSSTSKHGFLKKLDNDANHFMNGQGDWAAASSSVAWLATLTASNSATLEDTTHITSTYDWYEFIFENMVPATDNTYLGMRVSTDAGSTWKSTSYLSVDTSTDRLVITSPSNDITGISTTNVDDTAGAGFTGKGIFGNVNSAVKKIASFVGTFLANGGALRHAESGGCWNGGNDVINGVQFFWSSGNASTGKIHIYGVKVS